MFKSWPESLYGLTDAHHRQYHEFRRFRFNLKKRRNFWLQFGVWANYTILRSRTIVKSSNCIFLICTNYHFVVSNKNLLSSLVQNFGESLQTTKQTAIPDKELCRSCVFWTVFEWLYHLHFWTRVLRKKKKKNVLCEFLAKILLEFDASSLHLRGV
jgi:hypothetical protein